MYTIAVIGDVHANADWTVGTIKEIAKWDVDEIIQVGDFGFIFSHTFVDAVSDALDNAGLTMKFVEGNHDNPDVYENLPINDEGFGILSRNILRIPRGHIWNMTSEVKAMGLGGAISVDRNNRILGLSYWNREAISYGDVMRATQSGEQADIMFTHDCPTGINIPGINKDNDAYWPADAVADSNANRYLLRQVVDVAKPKMLLHGHYHTFYQDTLVGDDYTTDVYGLDCDNSAFDRNVRVICLPGEKG